MTDIMMCDTDRCPKSSQCYRHADSGTKANEYQSFWIRDETSPVGDDCGNFWENTRLVKAAHDGTF